MSPIPAADLDTPISARILVVEDEPDIRDICKRVLVRAGYQVGLAENGVEALERLAADSYDLVLTDLQMPRMGGMELLRILREQHSDLDVIVFTAYTTVETAREALKLGAFDYLAKPNIVDDLQRTVQRALEYRRVRLEKQRLSEIVALYQISQTFTSTLDTSTAVNEIVRLLWQRFAPSALSLSLSQPESGELELLAQRGEPLGRRAGARVRLWAGDERALLRGHIDLVGDDQAPAATHRACIILRTGERPVGVLRLARGPDQPGFLGDDRTLLDVCASQIAASLENSRLYRQIKEQNLQTIRALVAAIDARDPYTSGHSEQVMRYAVRLAEVLHFPACRVEQIRIGALLHDIGKIGIRDSILLKPGPLTREEFAIMRQHPTIGADILRHIESLREVIPMIRCHHERMDGGGYPDGRSGLEIPEGARIIAIADAYDAMTSDRAYRRAMPPEAAFRILYDGRGVHWDGDFVDAFIDLIAREGSALLLPSGRPAQVAYGVPEEGADAPAAAPMV
jgi:putative nucleotidyltransferase with HDIG domain